MLGYACLQYLGFGGICHGLASTAVWIPSGVMKLGFLGKPRRIEVFDTFTLILMCRFRSSIDVDT